MRRHKAYRVRIHPTSAQEAAFRQISGCCRLVYNLALEQRQTFWRQHKAQTGRPISWMGQKRELPALKAEAPFLRNVPAHCLQMALAELDAAFRHFFDGIAEYPQPRRKLRNDSFTFPDPAQIRIDLRHGLLILPKFGKTSRDHGAIEATLHRPVRGRIKRVTIKRDGKHWYASISVSIRVRRQTLAAITSEDVIGIDRGVTAPVVTSAGDILGSIISTDRDRGKRSRLQKALARTQKGSRRRQKVVMRLRAHRSRISRRRRDTCHKITSHLAKNHRVIVIESPNPQAVAGSGHDKSELPARNGTLKEVLGQPTLDIGWGVLRRQLLYKLEWRGGTLIEIPPRHPLQICSRCGTVAAEVRLSAPIFSCHGCGHETNADVHAAISIRRCGLEALGIDPRQELSVQSAEPSTLSMAMKRKEKNEGFRPQR